MTRKELYDLAWSQPASKIIKDFSISNTVFKRLCKENDIPLPENGYWQKLKHNKKVKIVPLPITDKKYPAKFLLGDLQKLSELNQLIRDIKNDKSLPLKVPENFIKTDEIIVRTKKYYSKLISAKNLEQPEEPKNGIFWMDVSESLRRRAYLFVDTLIKLVRARGHDLQIVTGHKYNNYNGTKLVIFGEYYNIRVREPNFRVMEKHPVYSWKEAKYYPTGKLSLKLDSLHDKYWGDTETKLLEDKLPDILAYFELRAKRDIKERISRKKWHEEYKLKQKIEEEQRIRRDKELSDFKAIINQSSRWQKSKYLREYISAVENSALEKGDISKELKTWLSWIKDKADWYDPFVEKEDELFKNVDRDSL